MPGKDANVIEIRKLEINPSRRFRISSVFPALLFMKLKRCLISLWLRMKTKDKMSRIPRNSELLAWNFSVVSLDSVTLASVQIQGRSFVPSWLQNKPIDPLFLLGINLVSCDHCCHSWSLSCQCLPFSCNDSFWLFCFPWLCSVLSQCPLSHHLSRKRFWQGLDTKVHGTPHKQKSIWQVYVTLLAHQETALENPAREVLHSPLRLPDSSLSEKDQVKFCTFYLPSLNRSQLQREITVLWLWTGKVVNVWPFSYGVARGYLDSSSSQSWRNMYLSRFSRLLTWKRRFPQVLVQNITIVIW